MRIMLIGGNKGLGKELKQLWGTHDIIEINRETAPLFDMKYPWGNAEHSNGVDTVIKQHLKIKNQYLHLDALVVCAGSGAFLNPVPKDSEIIDLFNINTFSPIRIYHAALKNLLKSKGKAIFISSTVARKPGSGGLSIYAASKGAINSWVVSEGRRAAKHGIGLCAVSPGYFESPMTDSMIPQIKQSTVKNIPFGRYAKTEEIALFIDALLYQSNWNLAGSIFELSGGA